MEALRFHAFKFTNQTDRVRKLFLKYFRPKRLLEISGVGGGVVGACANKTNKTINPTAGQWPDWRHSQRNGITIWVTSHTSHVLTLTVYYSSIHHNFIPPVYFFPPCLWHLAGQIWTQTSFTFKRLGRPLMLSWIIGLCILVTKCGLEVWEEQNISKTLLAL